MTQVSVLNEAFCYAIIPQALSIDPCVLSIFPATLSIFPETVYYFPIRDPVDIRKVQCHRVV